MYGQVIRFIADLLARADTPGTAGDGPILAASPAGDEGALGYRLESFSHAPVVDPGRYVDQPSMLLDARSQFVPFSGREDELATLVCWRDGDVVPVSALLLHGPGGQGKSRPPRRQ